MKNEQPTREKILDEVFKLVYINGYNGTSMSMILESCSIPKGSLYHFFKSKKELVLCVVKERLAPRMNELYNLKQESDDDGIETIVRMIEKLAQKEELVRFGCPMNRINQEMSVIDKDFEEEIGTIYESVKNKTIMLLSQSSLKQNTDEDSVADFVIAGVWGALSLSPANSSKERYLNTCTHLINYLKSLRK